MNQTLPLLAALLAVAVAPRTARAQLIAPASALFGSPRLMLTPPPLIADDKLGYVYVTPMRPGQNRVPWWDYEWQTYDFQTDRGGGGVRLYFYEREREAASYAVAAIREQYVRLTDLFHYLPRTTIPFILYASYAEFQATNVFFISEGTLGATDPRDLRMAQPFFGNVEQFARVSTHEMVHQFTVQKVRDAGLRAGMENPIAYFPLWFIEGLAEYGTFGGMDEEGDYLLRDLVTNPNPMKGYAMPGFFNDRAGGFIGVYKLGQARVTFLSETYGHEKVVDLLERADEILVAAAPATPPPTTTNPTAPGGVDSPAEQTMAQPPPGRLRTFAQFVAHIVGDTPDRIEERYQEWMKKRYYADYLGARQTVAAFNPLAGATGEPDSFSLSEDGRLLVYRTVERETGQSELNLVDLRDPDSRISVARDQRAGLESLHPVDRRVTSLRGRTLVFAARVGKTDRIFVRHIGVAEREKRGRTRIKLSLEDPETFRLGEILEVYDPALSPDGRQVAFAGIDPSGFRDLYVLSLDGADRGKLQRLTEDVWSESDLFWDGGRLLFVSDRTETHEPNLFSLELATRRTTRLTFHGRADRHPIPALGGVVYRSMREGKPDLWLLADGRERRLTDTSSAQLQAVPLSTGLLALVYHGGEHRLFKIPESALLRDPPAEALATEDIVQPVSADTGDAEAAPTAAGSGIGIGGSGGITVADNILYPRSPLPQRSSAYDPTNSRNWRVEAQAGALVGGTSVGAAAVAVTDLLRDHVVLINLAIYGSLKLTDALVYYINQSRRPELGIGVFHTFEPRRDKTFTDEMNFFLQREFGVSGLVRYPFDRFRRLEGSLEIRGVERFSFTDYSGTRLAAWERINAGIEPELVASVQLGADTTRMHAFAGPVEGGSALAAASVGYLPIRGDSYLRLLGDVQQRFRIFGRTHLMLRGAGGGTSAGRFSPQFYLSSIGNLEGFRFGDSRLLGDYFYVSNLRLTVPVDPLVQIPLFTGIYGVAGFDFGATFDQLDRAWQARTLAGVLGTDVALGALVFQLHFGHLIDIGGAVGSEPWVFNLNMKYLYY